MKKSNLFFILLISFLFWPIQSHAYIGPGIGVGLALVIVAILASIILGVLSIVYFPIKKLIKKIKKNEHPKRVK